MELKNGGLYLPDAQRGDSRIILGHCNITGEYGKCIQALANTIDITGEHGEPIDTMQVWVNYSAEGLQRMARTLAEAPFPEPQGVPTDADVRANLRYYWKAVHADGTVVAQWPGERNFGDIRPLEVVQFFLLPKDDGAGLPAYCLDRQEGFLRRPAGATDFERMDLPLPSVPWHLEYCFRPHITVGVGILGSETFPVHVRHELGWRVDGLHGYPQDTWCLLFVEDDSGDSQLGRLEPEDSPFLVPHLETLPVEESRRIEGEVRIVDAFGGSGI